ncbi:hypothetical protein RJ640_029600 [Escallonia rubra]|uniref:Glycosyltransferase N-terminal domain-containing protein n=1 Tax=Escallonia rubra TaxID=112253 RepID=A0AA88SP85_9ASTE|nr:hypothetical protein RJ640_029600 [Escallonia rubra]
MERQEVATGSKTHVLVFPFQAQGHMNPMIQFSKRLASKGLKVTLVVTKKSLQSQDSSIKVEHIADFLEDGNQMIDSVESFVESFRVAVSRGLPELIEKQNSLGCPVKVVVYDASMPWVLDIAHQLGLYGAVFSTQSCAVGAVYYHMHKGSLKNIGPVEGSTVSLPSMPLMETKDLSSFIYDEGSYPSMLRLVVNQFSTFEKADWRLFNTFDKLEGETGNKQLETGEMGSTKAHALVLPFPVQGHINPMLQFSKRLASKGLKVTVVATTNSVQAPDNSIDIEYIPDGSDQTDQKKDAGLERFKSVASRVLPDLIEKLNGYGSCRVNLVVYDSIVPWALDVAYELDVYGASLFTQSCQSCAVSAIYYHMTHGSLEIGSLEGENVLSPSMPLMGVKDLPSFISDMDTYPAFLGLFLTGSLILIRRIGCCSTPLTSRNVKYVVNWMASQWPVKTVGPTIPSMYLDKRLEDDKDYALSLFEPGDEDCIKWLNTKDAGSVVYVSFGSLANLGEDQMEELACGLKQSNRYFLWVVRASEESKLPTNFSTEASENGLLVNWCPQLKVLAHPAMGCFMTHCGWNSILEALSLGVPMLAVPQWTDQPTNAKYVVDIWQAGVRVKVDEKGMIRREEIETCIREVMEGERGNELKRNAVRWKELAKAAVDEGGSSDKHIDEFISELACN